MGGEQTFSHPENDQLCIERSRLWVLVTASDIEAVLTVPIIDDRAVHNLCFRGAWWPWG